MIPTHTSNRDAMVIVDEDDVLGASRLASSKPEQTKFRKADSANIEDMTL